MKAIGIVGSPRAGGNCEILTRRCLDILETYEIETELVCLAGMDIQGCTACEACKGGELCTVEDDLWPLYEAMKRSDVIIVSSPTYFGSATPELMAALDRCGYIARNNGHLFQGKVGSPIAVARRAGHNFTFAQLLMWYYICGMIVHGSTYWSIAIGRQPGEVLQDQEGLMTIDRLGHNLARLAQQMASS
jgi:multimeric flavodoxin WrbA